jgi:predicted transcriptional regulator
MSPKASSHQKLSKPLTEVELEMMNILWNISPCTVTEIQEHLPQGRDLAYTSVSTIVRILEQKRYVKSHKEGRGHIYSAVLKKEDYQNKSIHHMVKNVFDDVPVSLVRQLIQNETLSKKDLADIKALLDKRS